MVATVAINNSPRVRASAGILTGNVASREFASRARELRRTGHIITCNIVSSPRVPRRIGPRIRVGLTKNAGCGELRASKLELCSRSQKL